MIDLAASIGARGRRVDVVVINTRDAMVDAIGPNVRIVDLGRTRTAFAAGALYRYLRRTKPAVLMSTIENANALAAVVTSIAPRPKLVLREAATLQTYLSKSTVRPTLMIQALKFSYRRADAIIAVSAGIGKQLTTLVSGNTAKVHVVPNPVLTERVFSGAMDEVDHKWLTVKNLPVVLAAGRLSSEKGFDSLLSALALVLPYFPCKLIILGEGELRQGLQQLSMELGIEDAVDFPGFVSNPFAFMAKSDLFVLSSRKEGLPNVLVQALALCYNVVSTDCVTGPREILDDGELGRLVPVDEPVAMADAIVAALREPMTRPPKEWYDRYAISTVTDKYLSVLDSLT